MFRDLLSSRLIQAALVFCVLCVVGSLLYSWHLQRTTEKEMARHNRFLEGIREKQSKTRPPETVNAPTETETPGDIPQEMDESQITNDTEVSPINEATEFADIADAFLPDDIGTAAENAPEEDVPVSPFGFGPYPEVPEGYLRRLPRPSWFWSEEDKARKEETVRGGLEQRGISFTDYLRNYELIGRVGIKLWNEGRDFNGITTMDQTGLFYPDEPNVLYVHWRETTLPNGEVRRYMGNTIGSALQNMPIAAMEGREPPPDWIEIRSLNDGIDPYEYLGLNR